MKQFKDHHVMGVLIGLCVVGMYVLYDGYYNFIDGIAYRAHSSEWIDTVHTGDAMPEWIRAYPEMRYPNGWTLYKVPDTRDVGPTFVHVLTDSLERVQLVR